MVKNPLFRFHLGREYFWKPWFRFEFKLKFK
jgi:hypothetical protein